jgi:hypothetical protein
MVKSTLAFIDAEIEERYRLAKIAERKRPNTLSRHKVAWILLRELREQVIASTPAYQRRIKASIQKLLKTPPGKRVMPASFGSKIRDLIKHDPL